MARSVGHKQKPAPGYIKENKSAEKMIFIRFIGLLGSNKISEGTPDRPQMISGPWFGLLTVTTSL